MNALPGYLSLAPSTHIRCLKNVTPVPRNPVPFYGLQEHLNLNVCGAYKLRQAGAHTHIKKKSFFLKGIYFDLLLRAKTHLAECGLSYLTH